MPCSRFSVVVLLIALLVACKPEPLPTPEGMALVTPVPTVDTRSVTALCASIDANWVQDWRAVIHDLDALAVLDGQCGDELLMQHYYRAHVGMASALEGRRLNEEALAAYQQALEYFPGGIEAQQGIARLDTRPVLATCSPFDVSAAVNGLPEYEPNGGAFVAVVGDRFFVSGSAYTVRGINFYPRDYPNERFLTLMQVPSVDFELDLMQASGINTLRVFLRHDDLFQCPGNGAVPVVRSFERLDGFIHLAARRGFKLILVLHQDPDLSVYPLYDGPDHTWRQMMFIVQRYRDEPAIMAFDLRDRGDQDYRDFSQETVVSWLYEAMLRLRDAAPNQLITAGWDDDAAATAPLVDFVSFQHYGDTEALRQEIARLRDVTGKPLLLAGVGYSTYDMDEIAQRDRLYRALEAVEQNNLAGWLVWTAFDYPAAIMCEECPESHYGLWRASYFPKRALDAVHAFTLD